MMGMAEPKANPGLDPGLMRPKRSRKVAVDEDEPDLIAAK